MKNASVSDKQGSTSAIQKRLIMRRGLIVAVMAVAVLTSLTWIRPFTSGQASAETSAGASVKPEAELTSASEEAQGLSVAEAKAMSSGRMSDEEAAAFANFINTVVDQDICWRDTSTRGVGTIGTQCPAGTVQEGLLCYKQCPAGYSSSTGPGGLFCAKDCPAGWKTTPATCYIDADTINRQPQPCPAGWRDDGTACWLDTDIYGNGCSGNCREGYHNDGCTCRRDVQRQAKTFAPCPAGYTEFPLTCTRGIQSMNRDTVARGEVKTRGCGPGKVEDAGLCYNPCPGGSKGIGPVCWVDCPSNFPVNCGAACSISRAQCAVAVITMVASTGDLVLNVAELASGAGAAKVAIQKGIKLATKHAVTEAGRKILIQKAKTTLRNQARKNGKDIAEEALNKSAEALVGSYEKGEFDWTVLDPIGIVAVIDAFNKPICGR